MWTILSIVSQNKHRGIYAAKPNKKMIDEMLNLCIRQIRDLLPLSVEMVKAIEKMGHAEKMMIIKEYHYGFQFWLNEMGFQNE